jgi:hypothetical protein
MFCFYETNQDLIVSNAFQNSYVYALIHSQRLTTIPLNTMIQPTIDNIGMHEWFVSNKIIQRFVNQIIMVNALMAGKDDVIGVVDESKTLECRGWLVWARGLYRQVRNQLVEQYRRKRDCRRRYQGRVVGDCWGRSRNAKWQWEVTRDRKWR